MSKWISQFTLRPGTAFYCLEKIQILREVIHRTLRIAFMNLIFFLKCQSMLDICPILGPSAVRRICI